MSLESQSEERAEEQTMKGDLIDLVKLESERAAAIVRAEGAEKALADQTEKLRCLNINIKVGLGDMVDAGWTRQDWANERQYEAVQTERKTIKKLEEKLAAQQNWIPMSTPPTKEDSTPMGEVLFSFGYCISLATWDRKAWAAGIPPTYWMRIPPLPKPPQLQKKLISCDCSCADKCPQGKMGMDVRCKIWVEETS